MESPESEARKKESQRRRILQEDLQYTEEGGGVKGLHFSGAAKEAGVQDGDVLRLCYEVQGVGWITKRNWDCFRYVK